MRTLFFLAGIILFGIFLLSLPAFAQDVAHSGTSTTLSKDQTVKGNYFANGQSVDIAGTVDGDVYAAGGNVLIEGRVANDVIVAGGTVTIRGAVDHDVRVVGGQVIISGAVGGNVTAGGGNVTLADNGKIAGSLVAGGGQVSLYGPIGKTAVIGSGQTIIGSSIGGDVWAAGQLTLTGNAAIAGSLTYTSQNKAKIDPQAKVSGKITQNVPQQPASQQQQKAAAASFSFFTTLIELITAFLLGLLFLQLIPIFSGHVTNVVLERPWFSLLIGFLAVIIVPVLFVFLLILIIGIPFAMLLITSFFIMAYLAKIFISLAIGLFILRYANQPQANPVWVLLLGLIVYYLIAAIPVIGGIFWVIANMIGIGALLISERDYYLDLRRTKVI